MFHLPIAASAVHRSPEQFQQQQQQPDGGNLFSQVFWSRTKSLRFVLKLIPRRRNTLAVMLQLTKKRKKKSIAILSSSSTHVLGEKESLSVSAIVSL